jgi:hypothetical protein
MVRGLIWDEEGGRGTDKDGLIDEEDGGVGFEIDAGRLLDDFETFDGDVCLIGQAEADEVEHSDGGKRIGFRDSFKNVGWVLSGGVSRI